MSIPDPTYDDVEGVDLAILRAYDAFIEEQNELGQEDIYGIGFGQTATTEEAEPTPPGSPAGTPISEKRRPSITRRIPDRLTSHIPPSNFGAVIPGQIFRSQFPLPTNFSFMKGLKLKTILTLVPEPYPKPFVEFMDEHGIRHIRVHVPANKEVVKIEPTTMAQALGFVLDRANHPMLIHCNKGKHRTGCVVACFRKIMGESMSSIIQEYKTYAGVKARTLDEEFITGFDERALLWLARDHGFLDEPAADSPGVASLMAASRSRG